jgi:hypothetical protein
VYLLGFAKGAPRGVTAHLRELRISHGPAVLDDLPAGHVAVYDRDLDLRENFGFWDFEQREVESVGISDQRGVQIGCQPHLFRAPDCDCGGPTHHMGGGQHMALSDQQAGAVSKLWRASLAQVGLNLHYPLADRHLRHSPLVLSRLRGGRHLDRISVLVDR